ncbi:hypothetical protein A6S26_19615 [Nostoc sp. ATCC 43529]|nr:hypothetical protein A6S26_19615 [Nostoc sp. ATCC 43529]
MSKGKTDTLMPVYSLDGNLKLTSRHNQSHLLTFGNPKVNKFAKVQGRNVSPAHWLLNGEKPHQKSVLSSLLSKDYFASLEMDR